ncbi:MAG: hypothetical protein A3I63_08485 [Betaproteobacteria bacterium RIFCSPLOWO2_02_FULL_66_14]|nr:MAG: hypothetical protein A3I63_08485 [Betaproteobacteria bacterium RIFCSPLOWO2_02_FULL_66_14]
MAASRVSPKWQRGSAGKLSSDGQSAAFKEFVWRFVNVMARALVARWTRLPTGRTASLLSPDLDDPTDWRPVFDGATVINLRGIAYHRARFALRLEVAAAVGNLMFAERTTAATRPSLLEEICVIDRDGRKTRGL